MIQKKLGKNKYDIIIYTDGSSLGNPGRGGYGAVIVFQGKNKVIELGEFSPMTTNNKMELTAIIRSLQLLEKEKVSSDTTVVIHTDSSYAINGITKWIHGWKKKDWVTSTKTPVLNSDLWQELDQVRSLFTNITYDHVRGHMGIFGNERCDTIATSFAKGENVQLYNGNLHDYDPRILDSGKSVSSSEKKQKSDGAKKSGKAYSYVSVIAGKVQTHTTWEECHRRVNGKNAKFKKVFSKDEEQELMKQWNHLS
jgi:ribonuclease HI